MAPNDTQNTTNTKMPSKAVVGKSEQSDFRFRETDAKKLVSLPSLGKEHHSPNTTNTKMPSKTVVGKSEQSDFCFRETDAKKLVSLRSLGKEHHIPNTTISSS